MGNWNHVTEVEEKRKLKWEHKLKGSVRRNVSAMLCTRCVRQALGSNENLVAEPITLWKQIRYFNITSSEEATTIEGPSTIVDCSQ